MRKSEQAPSWAVYQITLLGQPGPNVVCHQQEWEAIERAEPGRYRLVRADIANEGEAERLARGVAGDTKPRTPSKKMMLQLIIELPVCAIEPDNGCENEAPVILPFSSLSDNPPHERIERA